MPGLRYIEINGEKFPIRYDLNALSEFEDLTGKSLINGISEQEVNSIKMIRALAYVGLKAGHYVEHKGKEKFPFTIEDVGSFFDLRDSSFLEEFNNSKPQVEQSPKGEGESPVGE
jgi:hypothetical protein